MTDIRPFKIAIPEAQLTDLQQRLANTILASEAPGAGWSAGPTAGFVTGMIDRLRNGFDNVQRVARGEAALWVVPELAD